ncbi:conserved hypothetical protein [Hyella patelloides LEGE 07179]|uniref:Uncharacterized protein n=1 Tax=Hyella patelloides LEGE 07179 TaxID=945734 RepID=A0A563W203_9CYAN|nr:hypothetical protein [Hyella patelloides]VEP17722.1 conserved hypothetical protein [Hyella patelloides LEGE 07179]
MTITLQSESLYSDIIFTSKDLNRKSGSVLDEAMKQPVTITRNSDTFALLKRERMGEITKVSYYKTVVISIMNSVFRLSLGNALEEHDPYQWINEFDNEDREEMVGEILQTLKYAEETNDWDELKSVIFEWRESAIANQGNELDEFKEALKENPVS